MRRWLVLLLFVVPLALRAQETSANLPRVHLTFVPETPADSAATEEYRQLWAQDERRIVTTLERFSHRRFVTPAWADTLIGARILEAPSYSGYRNQPMRLRSSYSRATKLAALTHELGHRLLADLFRQDEEEHTYLFLWLYDAWVALEGPTWAEQQVAIERQRGTRYVQAWDAALRRTPEQRARRWAAVLAERAG